MKNVIAVIDIGKTNKKIFLFDEKLEVVSVKKVQFEEIKDEDGFPCDDIEAIERWILDEIDRIIVGVDSLKHLEEIVQSYKLKR